MISNFFKSEEIGSIYIAMAGAKEWTSWQIKIAETYNDPIAFTKHLFYVFEDCAFVIERKAYAIDRTGLKREMKSILEDVSVCFPVLYRSLNRLEESPFPIGHQVTNTITDTIDFLHESRLLKGRGRYGYERKNLRYPPGWLASGRYQAATVFALFDYLVMKTSQYYQAGDPGHLRILHGIHTLLRICGSSGMFGSWGSLEESAIGKLPRTVIKAMDSISDNQLEEVYKDLTHSPVVDVVNGKSPSEVPEFIQTMIQAFKSGAPGTDTE